MASINPLQSSRLIYRAAELPQDVDFYHNLMTEDYLTTAKGVSNFLVPRSRQSDEEELKGLNGGSLIFAIVCLSPEEARKRSTSDGDIASVTDNNNEAGAKEKPVAPLTPIGIVGLSASGRSSAINRNSSMVIMLSSAFRGHGYGTEAIEWIFRWGFQIGGLHKIYLATVEYNDGAVRLYDRLFPRREAEKKEHMWWNGKWWTMIEWGILKGEWRESRGVMG